MDNLTPAELRRYARHLAIPGFGPQAQSRLKQSRVLVLGAGGLGSPILLYLAAAGIGHIHIVDFDQVELTNLQRQVLFTESDLGLPKARQAALRLKALNPHIDIQATVSAFTSENARAMVRAADLVVDGTDNFPTRYLSNDACLLEGKPLVYGSIYRFEGQVSVFNLARGDGSRGPNYRDLFPTPPPPELVPNCAEGGVLGVLPGIIGSLQASEAIKILANIGSPLDGELFLFDATTMLSRKITIRRQAHEPVTELIDYEQFCRAGALPEPFGRISPSTLDAWQRAGKTCQLLDVRQQYEREHSHIGGAHCPLDRVRHTALGLDKTAPTVVYCRSGSRSAKAARWLMEKGFVEVYNLEGGLKAYRDEVDGSLTVL
ncbi:molybdopterin-synthase adenylyltransferase MoeB [Phaeodactylibacter luteus]|uniref:Molybdopterin-synthase adenylyltransferase n=1 Tax=Phaeodactylibacter luteus TaxID=1564516 RepID=A0A5C6RH60_9BACT|nr:molybdopterin-synthase adenylyltransferase MoeB [Phaeodactylibacter luteus]TXB61716.1 molybdopterin-synthase adenylyltransferase MoeB [Phaeodactylibacter luteus]